MSRNGDGDEGGEGEEEGEEGEEEGEEGVADVPSVSAVSMSRESLPSFILMFKSIRTTDTDPDRIPCLTACFRQSTLN